MIFILERDQEDQTISLNYRLVTPCTTMLRLVCKSIGARSLVALRDSEMSCRQFRAFSSTHNLLNSVPTENSAILPRPQSTEPAQVSC